MQRAWPINQFLILVTSIAILFEQRTWPVGSCRFSLDDTLGLGIGPDRDDPLCAFDYGDAVSLCTI